MSFQSVQGKIAKREGISEERAGAILAASTRRAGAKARKKNPKLNRVKGKATPLHAFKFSGIMGGAS